MDSRADHVDTTPAGPPAVEAGVLGEQSLIALRPPAVRRLLAMREQRRLTRGHVRLAAECLGLSERTVWRWLAEATDAPGTAARPGARRAEHFEITGPIRVLLAYWHGNASAVHRQLVARARDATTPSASAADTSPHDKAVAGVPGGAPLSAVPLVDPVPSLSTFLRAVRRDLTAGERAGLAAGPDAARAHDVFGKRPVKWRDLGDRSRPGAPARGHGRRPRTPVDHLVHRHGDQGHHRHRRHPRLPLTGLCPGSAARCRAAHRPLRAGRRGAGASAHG